MNWQARDKGECVSSTVSAPAPAPTSTITSASTGDFISDYVDYADVYEVPKEAHEWAAIQLLASVMNGSVYIEWGGLNFPLDFWMLVLSESGGGRNTLTSVARRIAVEADIPGLIINSEWGSRVAMQQTLSEHPGGLYVWPEWGAIHKKFNDSQYTGLKEWFTNLYDESYPPDPIEYRRSNKKSDTPSIVFTAAPRMNIWTTSSLDWFTANLGDGTDITGGFLARFMPVVLPSGNVVPKPPKLDENKRAQLAQRLKVVKGLTGKATISNDAEEIYNAWYTSARKRFKGHLNSNFSMPFFNRLKGQVLKLAVVFEVAHTCSLIVSRGAMRRAIQKADEAEKMIFKLLRSGVSKEGSGVSKMEEKIRNAGAKGISQSKLTSAFKDWKSRDREDRLRTLIQM